VTSNCISRYFITSSSFSRLTAVSYRFFRKTTTYLIRQSKLTRRIALVGAEEEQQGISCASMQSSPSQHWTAGDGAKSYALTGKPETCRPIIRIDLDPTQRQRRQGDPGRVDNNRRGPKDTRPGVLRGRVGGEPEAATGRRRPVTKAGIVSTRAVAAAANDAIG